LKAPATGSAMPGHGSNPEGEWEQALAGKMQAIYGYSDPYRRMLRIQAKQIV
jgi:hypothetical protein